VRLFRIVLLLAVLLAVLPNDKYEFGEKVGVALCMAVMLAISELVAGWRRALRGRKGAADA
jgi:hypothetical protein